MIRAASHPLSVLLLTVTLVFAGCLGAENGNGGTPDDGGGDPFTAKDGEPQAAEVAAAWQGDAELYAVGTVEAPHENASLGTVEFEQNWGADANVGDGAAGAWSYGYYSPATETALDVIVYANGTVESKPLDEDVQNSGAVNAWSLDSPEILEQAKTNQDFDRILAEDDAAVGAILAAFFGPDPQWIVHVYSETLDEEATVFVHPNTGDVQSGF